MKMVTNNVSNNKLKNPAVPLIKWSIHGKLDSSKDGNLMA